MTSGSAAPPGSELPRSELPGASPLPSGPNVPASTGALLERIRADWQVARPGLDPSPMLTYLLLDRLHTALERQVSQTYAPAGLNPATWDLLLTLRRSAPPQGLTPTELAQLTAISGASITNRISRLLDKGLIERQVSEHDRRSSRIRLSRAGLALADELLPRHLHNELHTFSALGAGEVALLEALAAKLLASLEGLAEDESADAPR